jgi:hypothetical protein
MRPGLPDLPTALGQPAIPAGATCPRHAGAPAVALCRRCGTFVCAEELVVLDASQFCRECAARPDVDYLEAFRLKYWGKRDSWAWFFGFACVVKGLTGVSLVMGVALQRSDDSLALGGMGAAMLAWAVADGAFFAGARWARPAELLGVLLYGLTQALTIGPAALAAIIFPLAIIGSALASVRTKLFFQMDVPREQLRKAWSLLHDNVLARNALTLGVAGLVFGPFAPMALVLGIIGLRRVDPTAHPPVGRKGQAIAGIVLGALGTLIWGTFAVAALTGKL